MDKRAWVMTVLFWVTACVLVYYAMGVESPVERGVRVEAGR